MNPRIFAIRASGYGFMLMLLSLCAGLPRIDPWEDADQEMRTFKTAASVKRLPARDVCRPNEAPARMQCSAPAVECQASTQGSYLMAHATLVNWNIMAQKFAFLSPG